ncbi:hypothetical protein ABK040_001422 [Willaertia magna]
MLLSTPSPMSEDSVSNGGGNGNHNNLNNNNNNTSFNDEDYNLMNNNNNNNNQFNNNNTFFSNNHISSSSSLNVYPPTAVLKSTLYGKINQQRAGFPVCYNVQTAKVTLKLFLNQQQNTNTNNNNNQQPIFNMLQNRVYQYNEIDKLITKLAKNEIAIFGFVVFCENATKKREVLTNIDTYYSQSVNSQEYSINVAIGTYGKKCSSDLVKHCSFIVAYRMDQDQFQKQISTSRDSIHDYVPHYNNNTTFDKVFVQEIRFGFRKKSGREKLPLIKEPILCDVTKPIEYFDCLQNQNLLKVDDLLYSCYQPITRFVTSVQEAADSVVTTTQTFMESLSQKDIKSLIQQDLLINNYGNTNFGNNETMSTSTTSTTSNLGNLPVHLPVSLNNPTTISGNINNLLNNNNQNNNTLQQQHSILNHPILLNNTTNTTNNNLNFLQQQNTTTMNNTSPLTSNNTTSNNNNTTTTNHTTSLQQQQQQSTTLVENDDDQFDFFILNKTIENLSKSNIERWSTKNNEMSFHEHPSYIAVLLGLIYARGTFSIIENNKHRNNDPQTNPPQIPIHIDALDFLLIKYYGTVTIGTMMGNIQINLKDIFIRNEFETLFFYLQVKELLPNFIAGIYLYSLLYYTKSLNQYNQQQLKNQSTLQNTLQNTTLQHNTTLQNTLQQTSQEKELMKHYVQDIRAIYLQMSQNYYFEDFKMNLDIGDVLVKENLLSNEFINLAFNKLKLYAVKIGKYYYKLLNECDNLQNGGLLNNSLQNSLQNFNKQERLEMVINVLSNSFLRMNMSQQLSTLQQTSQQTNNNNGLNNLQNNLQQNNLQNNLGLSSSFSSSSLQFLNQSLTNDPTLQQASQQLSQSQLQSQQEENKRRRDFEYSGTSSFTGSDFIAHTKQKRSFAQQKYEDQKVKVLEQERNVMIMQTLLFNASTEGQEVIQTLYELEIKRLEIEKEFEEKLKLLAEKELLRDLL